MKNMIFKRGTAMSSFAALWIVLIYASPLSAQPPVYTIEIRDHRFIPAELTVPANQKLKLVVKNTDPTPEEFESFDFNREKIVPGKSEITVFIGPLKPGVYRFFGEFHLDTAQGIIKVVEGDPATTPAANKKDNQKGGRP